MGRAKLRALILRMLPVFMLAAVAPTLQASQAPLSVEDRLLQAHNQECAALGLPPLRWNPELAAGAANWAKYLSDIGALVHSGANPGERHPQGENLWAGTGGSYGPEEMVGLWRSEKANFRPGTFPRNSRTANVDDVSHYTQIVWRATTQVGCAVAHGATDDFLVCRYAEAGNVVGERPY